MRFNCFFSFHRACLISVTRTSQLAIRSAYFRGSVQVGKRKCELTPQMRLTYCTQYSWMLRYIHGSHNKYLRIAARTLDITCTMPRVFICLIPTYATWTCRERKLFFHTWRTRHTYASHISCIICFSHWPTRVHVVDKRRDPTGLWRKNIRRVIPKWPDKINFSSWCSTSIWIR